MTNDKLREVLALLDKLEKAVCECDLMRGYICTAHPLVGKVRDALSQPPTSDEGVPGVPEFLIRGMRRALYAAVTAKGMQLHEGKVKVDASHLERILRTLQAKERELAQVKRSCTCHLSDNPPQPCPEKYALSECREAAAPQAVATVWMAANKTCIFLFANRQAADKFVASQNASGGYGVMEAPVYGAAPQPAAPQEGKADALAGAISESMPEADDSFRKALTTLPAATDGFVMVPVEQLARWRKISVDECNLLLDGLGDPLSQDERRQSARNLFKICREIDALAAAPQSGKKDE